MPAPESSPPELARRRVAELVGAVAASTDWHDRSVELAEAMSRGMVVDSHPSLRRLADLIEGWFDRAAGVRVESKWPALEDGDLADAIAARPPDEDERDDAGPESDFDPENGIPFAFVPEEDRWYSVIALPDDPIDRWPVVECDPAAGDDAVQFVAIDVDHWLADRLVREGGLPRSPLAAAAIDDEVAAAVIACMAEAFGIDAAAAKRSRELDRAGRLDAPDFEPGVSEDDLAPLERLLVLPD